MDSPAACPRRHRRRPALRAGPWRLPAPVLRLNLAKTLEAPFLLTVHTDAFRRPHSSSPPGFDPMVHADARLTMDCRIKSGNDEVRRRGDWVLALLAAVRA